MASSSSNMQFLAACSAAFAFGAAAGAYAMHYYRSRAAAEEGQPRQTIDLSQLQGLPVPSGSGAFSETGSVTSFSLPPTPRMSRSGSNGISRQPSRSSSGGDVG